ncbi:hypothetical protein [uncultured Paludibaculum sp.]|uniref:hypothetical protein n=1 Tax=uncultured Paludibaculum sp. TaxID=1765020 RepID=UPI002AAB535E|nr:hypothetical protein [uncultured Paludibaculum sp.]
MRHFHGTLPVCLVLLAVTLTAGPAQEKAKEKDQDPAEAESHVHYPFITDAENRLIQDYYRVGSGHMPKKGDVPPALARQLHRAGIIPAGMDKKLDRLPEDLDRKLVPVPTGYLRRVCGMTILLILEKTSLVVDTIAIVRQ